MKRRIYHFLFAIALTVPWAEVQGRQNVVVMRSRVQGPVVVRQSPGPVVIRQSPGGRTLYRAEGRRPARRLEPIGEEIRNDRSFESRGVILRDRPIIFDQTPQFYSDGKTSVGLSFDF